MKSRFYLLTISFLIFYLLDPYYIYIIIRIIINIIIINNNNNYHIDIMSLSGHSSVKQPTCALSGALLGSPARPRQARPALSGNVGGFD
jgi:hypothetical protein